MAIRLDLDVNCDNFLVLMMFRIKYSKRCQWEGGPKIKIVQNVLKHILIFGSCKDVSQKCSKNVKPKMLGAKYII